MENRWIWPFELKEKIGQGGMGVVYRARYVKNDREVAVKLLPPEIAEDKKVVARFERELDVLKTLKHPNIVYCFGGKCEGDHYFYAMELVEGGSLERLLRKRGRLPWEQVVEYSMQLCSALQFSHEHGYVHRDIKPGNLLLTRSGKLKLSDFGLAQARSQARLTDHGKTMGTFHYMAPEQIRGKPPISGQTDLYAMGCVMYEMMAGKPPFQGNSPAEILQKHLDKAPPPVSTNAMDCPASLEKLILQLLSKKPEKRPATAMHVARGLKQILKGTSLDATTRDLTVRNTQAAQAVQEALGLPEIPGRRLRGDMNWLGIALVVCITTIAGMSAWYMATQSGQRTSGQAVELWVDAARSGNIEVRITAIEALEKIGPDAAPGVEVLIENLKAERSDIRRSAVRALGNIGAEAGDAVNELRTAQNDEDPHVREEVKNALLAIREASENDHSVGNWVYYTGAVLVALLGVGALVAQRIAKTMNA